MNGAVLHGARDVRFESRKTSQIIEKDAPSGSHAPHEEPRIGPRIL